MSLVFQNIDPQPPLRPASVSPPPRKAGGTHSRGGEWGGGSIFWKARDIGLPSYSNNLSTTPAFYGSTLDSNSDIHKKSNMADISKGVAGTLQCIKQIIKTYSVLHFHTFAFVLQNAHWNLEVLKPQFKLC